jgi:RNA polymerase sigma-70 factor (ECF subfamily)
MENGKIDTLGINFFSSNADSPADAAIDSVYRSDWGGILAALIAQTNDFDLAEEVTQEAFTAATKQWRTEGVPEFPRAWIIRTAKNKAIDRIRRKTRFEERLDDVDDSALSHFVTVPDYDTEEIEDDRLRLIFTCCHPALSNEAQVALTLRTLCGLETDEIARAFLVPAATMAQRLVRAKRKIRDAGIPFKVPSKSEIPSRLTAVLAVIYLVFNEGYVSTSGRPLVNADLCTEGIRLARNLRELIAPVYRQDVNSLLALMLLHDSRRSARQDSNGDIVTLDEQDRTLWDRTKIDEALPLVEEGMGQGSPAKFALEAAIAAEHCKAQTSEQTNWNKIVDLYSLLLESRPSPIVELNLAVAVAMARGPRDGLRLIDAIEAKGELGKYHLLYAARADLYRRLGLNSKASEDYESALALVTNESEVRFLRRRLSEVRPTAGQTLSSAQGQNAGSRPA